MKTKLYWTKDNNDHVGMLLPMFIIFKDRGSWHLQIQRTAKGQARFVKAGSLHRAKCMAARLVKLELKLCAKEKP